jgi:hypothetical protein
MSDNPPVSGPPASPKIDTSARPPSPAGQGNDKIDT